ncbi:Fic family protein [Subtercola frigoramans]|uniref:protein adenylyltransferase n=1 Tax=Subtercola frigoramans TaxID=120298 RepID=A0ABS2L1S2_9MICO|nr:Fic family protein [Subtercola frigoramans]MBM7471022.1 cell filamentation protein [Subtercola frigoramans]
MATEPGLLGGADLVSEEEIQRRVDFADAALALVRCDAGDLRHRVLVRKVASGGISADEAVAITAARVGASIGDPELTVGSGDDEYEIPGSSTLRNRLVSPSHPYGIDDSDEFRRIEREISRIRLVELAAEPVRGHLDYDHMKHIHRRIFGDVFLWAGRERVDPSSIVRFAPDAVHFEPGDNTAPPMKYRYFAGSDIAEACSVVYAQLHELRARKDLGRAGILDLMAELAGEIQTIHAFRDGNSRTVYVFALQFFEEIGYPADPSQFLKNSELRDRMIHARFQNHATGRHEAYFRTFDALLAT